MNLIQLFKKFRSFLFPNAYPSKIYRRADLIRLMRDKPEKYEEFKDEITLAYKQGRVV